MAPPQVFLALKEELGVTHECYASPLNQSDHTLSICSLFLDSDSWFGSRGSFFDFAASSRSTCSSRVVDVVVVVCG